MDIIPYYMSKSKDLSVKFDYVSLCFLNKESLRMKQRPSLWIQII